MLAVAAVFGGLSFQKDDLERKSEGFDQYGVNLGIYKQWANGLNAVSSAQLWPVINEQERSAAECKHQYWA